MANPSESSSRRFACWWAGGFAAWVVLQSVAECVWRTAQPAGSPWLSVWPASPGGTGGLLVLSVLLGVRVCLARRRFAGSLVLAGAGLIAALAVHAFWARFMGADAGWENWLAERAPALSTPGRRLSLQGAGLLLAAALGLFALTPPLSGRRRTRLLGLGLAALCVLLGFLTLVSYLAGNPFGVGEGLLPLTAFSALRIMVFNAGLLSLAWGEGWVRLRLFGGDPDEPVSGESRRERRIAFAVLVCLLTGIAAGGALYLRAQTAEQRDRIAGALDAIARLKASQIQQWRRERLGDANALARMPHFARTVEALAAGRATDEERANTAEWLRHYAEDYGYTRVVVLDSAWRPLLSEPDYAGAPDEERLTRYRSLSGGKADVVEFPLHVEDGGQPCWELMAFLREVPGAAPVGAVVLETDPVYRAALVLKTWSDQFRSGRSRLWLRRGGEIVPLGDATQSGALAAGIVTEGGLPLATGAIRGGRVFAEGIDERGVAVTTLGLPIPGSDWWLSCQMDSGEIYAPLRRDSWQVAATIIGLLVTVAALTGWISRQRQRNLVHERMKADLERRQMSARLGLVMRHARDIILILDSDFRILDANQQAVERYGWSLDELRGMSVRDFRAPGSLDDFDRNVADALSPTGTVFQTEHRTKAGEIFPVETSVRPVEVDGGIQVVSVIRDITERRNQERKIAQLGRLYRVLGEVNEVTLRAKNRGDLLKTACRSVVESGGFKLAWIGWHDAATKTIRPVEQHGDVTGYASGILITTDDRKEGHGPSGMAFRGDRTYVCNDFFADPATGPWRERARAAGIASSIAIPLRMQGVPVALLTVYDGAPECFGLEETALLERAAANISFTFETMEQEERRQAAERALHESEARYRMIGDNLPESMVYQVAREADGTMRFLHVSAGVERLHGLAAEDVLRDASLIYRQMHEDDVPRLKAAEDESHARLSVLAVIARIRRPDGQIRWQSISSNPRREASGRVVWDGIATDITERRLLELSVRENARLLTAILDHASVGIAYTDAVAGIHRVNRCLCEMLGVPPERLLGGDFKDFTDADGYAKKQAEMARLRDGLREDFVLELRFRRADGGHLWARLSVTPLRDAAGKPEGYVMVVDDFTERKQARETLLQFNAELEQRVASRTAELAARNAEIESLLDSLPDTVLLCDRAGRPLSCRLPHLAEAPPFLAACFDPVTRTFSDPGFDEQLRRLQAEAWESPQGVVRELDVERRGQSAALEVRAAPIGAERLLILLRDITARRRVERDMVANLEREKQLSDMKSRFVSVASHEFRTPLAAAVGSLELLERHADDITDGKRAELLARIQRSLARLTAIMNDVLSLSRADSGRVTVRRMAADLPRYVQDVLREIELGDRQRHAFDFTKSGGPDVAPVDTNLLHHVLSNLLGNAVRYSPAGTRVAVELVIDEREFRITVADEGIGIPEAERDKVFDPFVRGSNTGHIGGTGLGLNIVKRYTELMGGEIALLPSERGAIFRLKIPLVQPAS